MSHPDPRSPHRPSSPQTAGPPARGEWTPARQRVFLTALAETGSVARAAQVAGMSRSSAHRLRTRLKGTAFDRDWARTLDYFARQMADPLAGARK